MEETPYISETLTRENQQEVTSKIVQVIRPQWKGEFKIQELPGGYINMTVHVTNGEDQSDSFVVRTLRDTFGSTVPVLHQVMDLLTEEDLGAALLARFENGVVMEYLHGQCITWDDRHLVRNPHIRKNIARELARYHCRHILSKAMKIGIPEMCRNMLWGTIVKDHYDEVHHGPLMPESDRTRLPDSATLLHEASEIYDVIESLNCEKAFCHLDLNVSNIVILEKQRDPGVMFVDYDSTGISYAVYDITWFFSTFLHPEMADHTSEYPDRSYQISFLREYLDERSRLDQRSYNSDDENTWMRQIQVARLLMLVRLTAGAMGVCYIQPNKYRPQLVQLAVSAWLAYNDMKLDILSNQK